ncbi:porin [Candidatus Tisiphia endosymbiont of Nemotelus uliginosus]|uniref:porin n=1 Tax=Candidatus Tisiphia endosymbiont of Nemotelus uliginosus TaxID=3077926 RepID=UPI0035C8BCCE
MKKLLMLLGISCLTSTVVADCSFPTDAASDTEIKLEGFFGFQAGYSNQNKLQGLSKNITDNKKRLAFFTEAAFSATIRQELNNVVAGAKIVLMPTSKVKTGVSANGSHLFLETDYGKVELGSPHDASAKMRVTGYKVVAATGTNWNKYIQLDSPHMMYKGLKPDFDTSDNFYMESFSNGFNDMNMKTEAARKVSYYTPKMEGFQFGISYTPDSANTGGNSDLKNLDIKDKNFSSKSKTGIKTIELGVLENNNVIVLNQNVKDAVSAGISYQRELLDDVAMQVAVTGEFAKPARKLLRLDNDKDKNILSQSKLSNLKAYNIGAVLSYGNFSCGASYGSLGKSLTSAEYHKVGRVTEYYNGAVAYTQGPIKTSLSYFRSLRYKNTTDAVSLGTEYLITPGMLPYAEISYFQAKGKPVYLVDAPKAKTRGTVALIGAKLKF